LPPIISAREISKRFGSMTLFEGLTLTVNDDTHMGLIGPNGSGKSTLAAWWPCASGRA
jgi:ABC-type branched-subunit amino acid transport system ATPase component